MAHYSEADAKLVAQLQQRYGAAPLLSSAHQAPFPPAPGQRALLTQHSEPGYTQYRATVSNMDFAEQNGYLSAALLQPTDSGLAANVYMQPPAPNQSPYAGRRADAEYLSGQSGLKARASPHRPVSPYARRRLPSEPPPSGQQVPLPSMQYHTLPLPGVADIGRHTPPTGLGPRTGPAIYEHQAVDPVPMMAPNASNVAYNAAYPALDICMPRSEPVMRSPCTTWAAAPGDDVIMTSRPTSPMSSMWDAQAFAGMPSLERQTSRPRDAYPQPNSRPYSPMSRTSPASKPRGMSPLPQVKPRLDDFTIVRTLGTGSFGRVCLAFWPAVSKDIALKVMGKAKILQTKQVEHVTNERRLLSIIRHPFIVQYYGSFQDTRNVYLVMEYVCGGELFGLLHKAGRLPDATARFYAAEILLALEYFHGNDILYRDLKPENVLIAADGHVKLTDLGFAKRVRDRTYTLCGTPEYMAPEVLSNKGYGKSADYWAFGVLLYEMLCGHTPFVAESPLHMVVTAGFYLAYVTEQKVYERIVVGHVDYPPYLSIASIDLMGRLLNRDRTARLGCLRGGAEDIKTHIFFYGTNWHAVYAKAIPSPYIPPQSLDGRGMDNFEKYPEVQIQGLPPIEDPYAACFTEL